jgi:hypothetical protein
VNEEIRRAAAELERLLNESPEQLEAIIERTEVATMGDKQRRYVHNVTIVTAPKRVYP